MFRIVARLRCRARRRPGEIAADERDARALDGHVGPRPHRDAHVGRGQRGRVVDAVARHRDDPALALQPRHGLGLPGRKHARDDLVDAELLRHGLGRRLRVAREHHDANPEVVHRGDRGARGRPDRIRRREEPGGLPVHGDEENRLALRARGVGLGENIGRERRRETKRRSSSNSGREPTATVCAFDSGLRALAGDRLEVARFGEGQLSFTRRKYDGAARADARSRAPRKRRVEPASSSCHPCTGLDKTIFGFPSVSVPVLSTTSVSTFSSRSSAAASLKRTPAAAPRPIATMTDIGVARPSAHGQAMMRTATAFTSA